MKMISWIGQRFLPLSLLSRFFPRVEKRTTNPMHCQKFAITIIIYISILFNINISTNIDTKTKINIGVIINTNIDTKIKIIVVGLNIINNVLLAPVWNQAFLGQFSK